MDFGEHDPGCGGGLVERGGDPSCLVVVDVDDDAVVVAFGLVALAGKKADDCGERGRVKGDKTTCTVPVAWNPAAGPP